MAKSRLQTLEERVQAIQDIAVQLISAKDNSSLLNLIVERATHLTGSDAAALYLRKDKEHLEFVIARNNSLNLSFNKQTLRIDGESIAAYVFRTQKTIRIEDAYTIPKNSPYAFDNSFDKKSGYLTQSILAVPLVTSKNHVLGVLQVINKMPYFLEEDEKLIQGFGALASASIEKTTLYEDIERILEGFLHASVKVIDERDPSTRGHSERVAVLTRELAVKTSEHISHYRFTDTQLREIYYASLLHDFGKVGVREAVLLKPDKLFLEELLTIQLRLKKLEYKELESYFKETIELLWKSKKALSELEQKSLLVKIGEIKKQYEGIESSVLELNKPTVLNADLTAKIQSLKNTPYLESKELEILSIPRGSLTISEKKEIEDHVSKTYRFLSEIPWTKEFSQLADIAHAHHEKLDGSGYPRRLKENEIPVQSKMMAICDIYDALVASDRPYKAALPQEKALDILHMEVKAGKLDASLLEVFTKAKVFNSIQKLLPKQSHKKAG